MIFKAIKLKKTKMEFNIPKIIITRENVESIPPGPEEYNYNLLYPEYNLEPNEELEPNQEEDKDSSAEKKSQIDKEYEALMNEYENYWDETSSDEDSSDDDLPF